jgi:dienelactone hydrolase
MQEYVVLLHGIFQGHRSMEKIAFALDEAGYEILNID